MAPKKDAAVPDFGAFINEAREKKKNQTLAQQIFGNKGRRASAPGGGLNKKPPMGGSLASRMGVQKRSNSSVRSSPRPAGNVNAEWTHDLHSLNNPSSSSPRVASNPPRGPRGGGNNHSDRLRNALSNSASSPALNSQFNIVGSSRPSGPSISIRGIATGPFCVVAKNLAPGTTAADIESAMTPMGGVVLSSVIIAERPKVIAEIVFETKEGADNVVDTLNNQNADGNILHVYHKQGTISSAHKLAVSSTPSSSREDHSSRSTNDNRGGNDRYTSQDRDRGGRRERDYEREDVIDGSHGFEDRMETDDNDNRGGLYSDSLVSNRGRGPGNNRDRGRGNGNDRSRGYR